ncbi:MAG: aminotransferase class I/II-fold pyridoxal phosphate-dependent enzyme [Eubacterium sp.]|nr:aminotransferase class I/II-fold pyridoxal phosphate-dependent enzyme [Eubacterium sp.]
MAHGGDIYRNRIKYDFSVNINPLGRPESVDMAVKEAFSQIQNYPDPEHESIKKEVAAYSGIHESDILLGNGASELIMALMGFFSGRRILLPAPSFLGYKVSAEACGCQMSYITLKEEKSFSMSEIISFLNEEGRAGDVLIFANPANPVGNILSEVETLVLLDTAAAKGVTTIIDECFMSLIEEPELSAKKYVRNGRNGLAVLDAFTKSFAIPGIRLGMLYTADREILDGVAKKLPEWNISCFAEAAGVAAAKEKSFLKKSAEYIKNEREILAEGIRRIFSDKNHKIEIFDGIANFILIKCDLPLYDMLLKRGILIRNCEDYIGLGRGFFRIAVKNETDNNIFLTTLKEVINIYV